MSIHEKVCLCGFNFKSAPKFSNDYLGNWAYFP